MDTQLKKKIVEDLKKTGFGSEMKVMQILAANNWRSSGGTGFFDKDEKITREIDVTAYRPLVYKLSSEATFRCFFHLSIEVKKSKVPWIVFKQELRDNDTLDAWNNVIFVANLPDDSSIFMQALSTASLLIKNRWKGT